MRPTPFSYRQSQKGARALLFLGAILLVAGPTAWAKNPLGEPAQPRQQELVRLVRQECGACHGLHLQGGLGPPLTPASLWEKPREGLVATIMHGRHGTAMPPFAPFLTESEAQWIVEKLRTAFPELAP